MGANICRIVELGFAENDGTGGLKIKQNLNPEEKENFDKFYAFYDPNVDLIAGEERIVITREEAFKEVMTGFCGICVEWVCPLNPNPSYFE